MRNANRINTNAKWIREQMKALRDNEIVYVWHEMESRIKDIDLEIASQSMQVNKATSRGYVMFKLKER